MAATLNICDFNNKIYHHYRKVKGKEHSLNILYVQIILTYSCASEKRQSTFSTFNNSGLQGLKSEYHQNDLYKCNLKIYTHFFHQKLWAKNY